MRKLLPRLLWTAWGCTCILVALAMLVARAKESRDMAISVGTDRYATVDAWAWDTRLFVFNANGPWHGSLANATSVQEYDVPLFDYSRIAWPNGQVSFGMSISLLPLLIPLALPPLVWIAKRRYHGVRGYPVQAVTSNADRLSAAQPSERP